MKMDSQTRNRIIDELIADGYSVKEAEDEVREMEAKQ